MFYRSLVLGLLGAAVLLIADESARRNVVYVPVHAPECRPASDRLAADRSAVIDVSRRLAGFDVLPYLGLARGEAVTTLGGAPAASLDVMSGWLTAAPGDYLDVGVRGPGGRERRILVLVHP